MKVYLTLYLASITSIFCFSQNDAFQNGNLTPQQLKEDFSILRSSLENNHPDLYLYTPKEKLDSFFLNIENELESEKPPLTFLNYLLHSITE